MPGIWAEKMMTGRDVLEMPDEWKQGMGGRNISQPTIKLSSGRLSPFIATITADVR
jgi:hypothetical protein